MTTTARRRLLGGSCLSPLARLGGQPAVPRFDRFRVSAVVNGERVEFVTTDPADGQPESIRARYCPGEAATVSHVVMVPEGSA